MKKHRIIITRFLLSFLLISTVWSTSRAQVIFEQTYPILFPSDTSGFRLFPDFNIEQTTDVIQLTDCLSEVYTVLQIQQLTGELLDTLSVPAIPCGNFSLSNGTTLMVEPASDGTFGYVFTNYLISGTINWQRTYSNLPFFINNDNIIPDPSGGFFLYNRSPFILQRYSNEGQLLYSSQPLDVPNAYGTRILKVAENGDLYLRSGHLGGNDTKIIISKLDGNSGAQLWQTDIPTVRNLAQDTRIALAPDYPLIVVNNNYGSIAGNGLISGGWDIAFLDAATGELIHQKEKIIIGNAALTPTIIKDKGIYLLEEQHIDLEESEEGEQPLTEEKTGFSLFHYSNEGEELWKKPLFPDLNFTDISLAEMTVSATDDLLLLGTKYDSLWLVKLDPDGDLYTAPDLEDIRPDLQLEVTTDRNDLPIYDFLTFEVTLTNNGKGTAKNILIHAPFVDYQTLTATEEQNTTHGIYYNWTGDWSIDSLSVGESATLSLKTFVLSNEPTTRLIKVTEQMPVDFDNIDNSILLNLPTGQGSVEGLNVLPLKNNPTLPSTQIIENQIQIQLMNTKAQLTTFSIYDVNGKLMLQQDFSLQEGQQLLDWNIGQLPTGTYILQEVGTNNSWKFIRQRNR